ncbi:MAG: acetyltransferase [Muribaculaceae bacterium]|nr:acetyltransferase [Muribaculaceae bacterium]
MTLYGAGGHCKVVMDILGTRGYGVVEVADDNPVEDSILGVPVRHPREEYDSLIVTIGNCNIRRKIVSRLKVKNYPTVTHPSAIVAPTSTVGQGTVIVHGAIIQACSRIGDHCIINTKASVGHDCVIGDFVHVASGATVCGECVIGDGTWIGAGSVVKQGIHIGRDCMIGAGAAVVSDIPDGAVAVGVPARVIKYNT